MDMAETLPSDSAYWNDYSKEIEKVVLQKKRRILLYKLSLYISGALGIFIILYLVFTVRNQKQLLNEQRTELMNKISHEQANREEQVKEAKLAIDSSRREAANSIEKLSDNLHIMQILNSNLNQQLEAFRRQNVRQLATKVNATEFETQLGNLRENVNGKLSSVDFIVRLETLHAQINGKLPIADFDTQRIRFEHAINQKANASELSGLTSSIRAKLDSITFVRRMTTVYRTMDTLNRAELNRLRNQLNSKASIDIVNSYMTRTQTMEDSVSKMYYRLQKAGF